jgi:hypothetical protein
VHHPTPSRIHLRLLAGGRRPSLFLRVALLACAWLVPAAALAAAAALEGSKGAVPKSPYIAVVYRYADALLEKGRDTYGPQQTGLFLSALDRATLAPLTNRPAAPAGVEEADRAGEPGGPLVGANPQHDENLLRLLYLLSELSSKPRYRQAADASLQWFLAHAPAPATGLLPWGRHSSWNALKDEPLAADGVAGGTHEFLRPWLLWERCFEIAPPASKRFALGLWEHQIADHQSGAFDEAALLAGHSPRDGRDLARHAGFFIRTWAMAYAQTQEPQFLRATECLLARFEKKRDPKTGWIEAYRESAESWPSSTLSLAIDCDGAAHWVAEPLASRLRDFASREDGLVCGLPQELERRGGFAARVTVATGKPTGLVTPRWQARPGENTTAQVGMMCVARYDNTGQLGFRRLLLGAADAYLDSMPATGDDVWPGTFGQAISLLVAAWRHTARLEYLDRARALADFAIERYFDGNPLPRASLKSAHYESITGADTLALALAELHLQVLHITAVRCPPNTIDR